jgi:FkbM family methyltransferase
MKMKQLVQAAVEKFGYRIVPIDNTPRSKHAEGLDPLLSTLKYVGFAPRHIVDVGANKGIWTREAIKFFPTASYTLVEPQNHLRKHIQDLIDAGYKLHWINLGVSDKSGRLPFHVSVRDDSSSFVREWARPGEPGFLQTAMDVTTLNEIVRSRSESPPDMVKIDAEGLDLKVLDGASDLFGKTEIFLVEASVFSGGENTLAEVIHRMSLAGYHVIDITDLNRSPKYGVVWLCELAFLRNGSTLLNAVTSYE